MCTRDSIFLDVVYDSTYLWEVFFCQAEDGIRDVAVTGFQTCALPIWRLKFRWDSRPVLGVIAPMMSAAPELTCSIRLEERRVGKACRSRWSPGP